jgi:hypothetical protein
VLVLDASNITAVSEQKEWVRAAIQKSPYGWATITKYRQAASLNVSVLPFPAMCRTSGLSRVRVTIFRNGLCLFSEFNLGLGEYRYAVDWYDSQLQNCSSPSFEQVDTLNNANDVIWACDGQLLYQDSFMVVRP